MIKYFFAKIGSGYTSAGQYVVAQTDSPIHTLAILQTSVPDFIEPSKWSFNSSDLSRVDYSTWVLFSCSAASLSSEVQKYRSSETSPKQLLRDDQPRIKNQSTVLLNDCCWSFIRTVDIVNIVSVNSVICACCKLFLS